MSLCLSSGQCSFGRKISSLLNKLRHLAGREIQNIKSSDRSEGFGWLSLFRCFKIHIFARSTIARAAGARLRFHQLQRISRMNFRRHFTSTCFFFSHLQNEDLASHPALPLLCKDFWGQGLKTPDKTLAMLLFTYTNKGTRPCKDIWL